GLHNTIMAEATDTDLEAHAFGSATGPTSALADASSGDACAVVDRMLGARVLGAKRRVSRAQEGTAHKEANSWSWGERRRNSVPRWRPWRTGSLMRFATRRWTMTCWRGGLGSGTGRRGARGGARAVPPA